MGFFFPIQQIKLQSCYGYHSQIHILRFPSELFFLSPHHGCRWLDLEPSKHPFTCYYLVCETRRAGTADQLPIFHYNAVEQRSLMSGCRATSRENLQVHSWFTFPCAGDVQPHLLASIKLHVLLTYFFCNISEIWEQLAKHLHKDGSTVLLTG